MYDHSLVLPIDDPVFDDAGPRVEVAFDRLIVAKGAVGDLDQQ